MTTQKPELMPDTAYLEPFEANLSLASLKKFHLDTSYTRTDLYTAACAERDALRELCERMAGALRAFARHHNCLIDFYQSGGCHIQEGYPKHRPVITGKYYIGDGEKAGLSFLMVDDFEKAEKALTAYEKHKAGE